MSDFENNEQEEEIEQLSDEEILKIAQHFLLSSPPGQFTEVLAEIKKIVPGHLLSESVVSAIARISNLKTAKVVTAPTGKKVLVTPAAEIDPNHYFDPVNNVTFNLNHLTLATAETEEPIASNQDEELSSYREALQSKINLYIKSNYSTESSAGGVYANNGNLSIVISGEKVNLKNFWSGKWSSSWTVNVENGSAKVSGEIKLHVHYFEDGNLQLQTSKSIPSNTISFSAETDFADKVLTFIQQQETSLQSGLEEMYTNMNNETFRSMRRIMPITRTKMDWNINAVRMVRQVRK